MLCGGIERFDTADKLPPVRQVDVVATSVDSSTRDGVALALEGACGMNNGLNPQLPEIFLQLCALRIDTDGLILVQSKVLSHAATAVTVASPDQKADGRILCECSANARAEEAVATND